MQPSKSPTGQPTKAPTPAPTYHLGITSWVLVNAATNEDIGPITTGQVLNLAVLPKHLNIRAEATEATTEVQFFENNGNSPVESQYHYPYAYANDYPQGDYHASATLKILTSSLTIKALPFRDLDLSDNEREMGTFAEITISIISTGRVSVDDTDKLVGITPLTAEGGNSISDYYYGTNCCAAGTPDGLETTNNDKVTFAVVNVPQLGNYILVIYDSPQGETAGSATVSITKDGPNGFEPAPTSDLAFSDSPSDGAGFPSNMAHNWSASMTDGFAVGPYSEPTELCFSFSNVVNLVGGSRFYNGDLSTIFLSTGSGLISNMLCIKTPSLE